MRAYREQYGNQAFDQYLQEESRRDEQSEQPGYNVGQQQEDDDEEEEAPLAIEYQPDQAQ